MWLISFKGAQLVIYVFSRHQCPKLFTISFKGRMAENTKNQIEPKLVSKIFKESFTYYVITEEEGGGFHMITLHVIVTNTTTVKVITGMGEGVWNRSKTG